MIGKAMFLMQVFLSKARTDRTDVDICIWPVNKEQREAYVGPNGENRGRYRYSYDDHNTSS